MNTVDALKIAARELISYSNLPFMNIFAVTTVALCTNTKSFFSILIKFPTMANYVFLEQLSHNNFQFLGVGLGKQAYTRLYSKQNSIRFEQQRVD